MKGFFVKFVHNLFPFKGDGIRQSALKIVFLVSLATMLISGIWLISYHADSRHAEKEINAARDIWRGALPTERFDSLRKENSDFRAWLSISSIGIDHPVYQAEDNAYYLKHNGKKESSRYGALFFSYDDTADENGTDKNLVIFGHNMKDGSMFAPLEGYRNQEFFEKNREIVLSFGARDYTYEIFSVCVIDVTGESGEQPDVMRDSFETPEQLSEWAETLTSKSLVKSDIFPEFDSGMLTLITCGDDYAKTRIAVSAVLKN